MDWIEGPTAVDDSSHLLRVVARPGDELQAVDDGRRQQRLPQCSLVFVEIPQDRGEKVCIVVRLCKPAILCICDLRD
jgi:hypothetical protein